MKTKTNPPTDLSVRDSSDFRRRHVLERHRRVLTSPQQPSLVLSRRTTLGACLRRAVLVAFFSNGVLCTRLHALEVSGTLTLTGADPQQIAFTDSSAQPASSLVFDPSTDLTGFVLGSSTGSWSWALNSGTTPLMDLDPSGLALYSPLLSATSGPVIFLSSTGETTYFTNSVALKGTNNLMPHQLLSGTASVLTRQLADQRYIRVPAANSALLSLGSGASATGLNSVAMGSGPTASGQCAVALGADTTASAAYATAFGMGSQATGFESIAGGHESDATSTASVALGYQSHADGDCSIAFGIWTCAAGACSFAAGSSCQASNDNTTAIGNQAGTWGAESTALGSYNWALGDGSMALGYSTTAEAKSQTVVGQFNKLELTYPQYDYVQMAHEWNPDDALFTIGNGTDVNHSSNALVVKKSGDTTVYGKLTVSGSAAGIVVTGTMDPATGIVVSSGTNALMLVPQQGDLSMGEFHSGIAPTAP